MLLSTVSILVVAQSIFEIPEGIMNNLVYIYIYIYMFRTVYLSTLSLTQKLWPRTASKLIQELHVSKQLSVSSLF